MTYQGKEIKSFSELPNNIEFEYSKLSRFRLRNYNPNELPEGYAKPNSLYNIPLEYQDE